MAKFCLLENVTPPTPESPKSNSNSLHPTPVLGATSTQKRLSSQTWKSYFLMCARAMLLTNTMLDMLMFMPRFFNRVSTSLIPATLPLLPRAWTSLVRESCVGTRSSDSMDLSFSRASVAQCKEWACVWQKGVCVCVCACLPTQYMSCFLPWVRPLLLSVTMSRLVAVSLSWKVGRCDVALRETQSIFLVWYHLS